MPPSRAQTNAPSSVAVMRKYFTIGEGGLVNFKTAALLTPDTVKATSVVAHEERDISNAINSYNNVRVIDLMLKYDDNSLSTIFLIKDAVIEYRPSILRVQDRRTNDQKSVFKTGYMVTYASVGIPTEVYHSLEMKIKKAGHEFECPKLTEYGDYCWMPVKTPEELSFTMFVDGNARDMHHLGRFMQSLGRSVIGNIGLSMRLKLMTPKSAPAMSPYELGATIVSYHVRTVTKLSSPPINSKSSTLALGEEDLEMTKLLRDIRLHSDALPVHIRSHYDKEDDLNDEDDNFDDPAYNGRVAPGTSGSKIPPLASSSIRS
uniref:Uncharacterized protein n=1 Tax=Ustilago esculenta TaxID=185366 RepID=A0A481SHT9_9BASI|nr:hypothetical protein UE_1360 [Ustilago esculenta]